MSVRLSPLVAPVDPPPRYSQLPLPAYRHVPGLTPHPVSDPRGHSYGRVEASPPAEALDLPEGWSECTEYRFGADLFNRAFLWEAHEAWEAIWIAAGTRSIPGLFVQGLILAAASLLQRHLNTPRGARRLWAKAGQRLDEVSAAATIPEDGRYMGLEVQPWRRAVDRYLQRGEPFPFVLLRGGSGPGPDA